MMMIAKSMSIMVMLYMDTFEAASLVASSSPFHVSNFQCSPISMLDFGLRQAVLPLFLSRVPAMDAADMPASPLNLGKPLNPAARVVQIAWCQLQSISNLGDSVSAGLFVDERARILLKRNAIEENRPLSWSNGAAPGHITLFNMIRALQPNLLGGSTAGTKRFEVSAIHEIGYNMAVSRSFMSDAADQVIRLLAKWRSSQMPLPAAANGTQHPQWNMINVFLGSNDLCYICEQSRQGQSVPAQFEHQLRAALELLRQSEYGDRVLVQLYGLFDLTEIGEEDASFTCRMVRRMGHECPCLFRDHSTANLDLMRRTRDEYNNILNRVALEYQERYLSGLQVSARPDDHGFLVYYQPVLTQIHLRQFGTNVLSPVDCFHPNQSGQLMFAAMAFQSMQVATFEEKVGVYATFSGSFQSGKSTISTGISEFQFQCPDSSSYIQ